MRTPMRAWLKCWLFATVAILIAASAFGGNTVLSSTCGNSGWRVHITQVLVTTGVPDGSYSLAQYANTSATGGGTGDIKVFGTLAFTVSGGAATITTSDTQGVDATTSFTSGQTRYLTWSSPTYAAMPSGGLGTISATRTDCGTCGSCTTGGGITTYDTTTVTFGNGTLTVGSSHFSGQLHVGAHGAAHTFALKYNGATVDTETTPVNSATPFTSSITFNNTGSAHTGDTWAWVVDGVTQTSGVVTLTNIGTPEAPIWSYTTTYDSSISGGDAPTPTPSATPTPTAFPTVTPYATPTPTPGGTPPPSIIRNTVGGGTIFSQAVTVVNPADIYNPIVADINKTNTLLSQPAPTPDNSAIVNKLDEMEHSGTTAPGTATDTHESADFTGRGHLDDLQGSVDAGISARNDVVSSLTDAANAFIADASALSGASFGSTTTIPMPFSFIGHAPAVGRIDLPDSIDLGEWAGLIAMLRAVLLWLLRIAFWVLVYKLFAAHGIQAT